MKKLACVALALCLSGCASRVGTLTLHRPDADNLAHTVEMVKPLDIPVGGTVEFGITEK